MKISVIVKPQSKKAEVKKLSAGEYAVSVRAPAREGKANEEAVELLAEHFSAPKSAVRIVRGERGRRKIVELP